MKVEYYARLMSLFGTLLLSALLVSCVTMPEPPANRSSLANVPESEPVSTHAWSYLRKISKEPRGYGAYTYVLAGRVTPESPSVSRFYKLVDAVQDTTSSDGLLNESIPRGETNIFLIPAKENEDFPDQELSKSYATALEAVHENFINPGPFLVVVCEPLSSIGNNVKNLLIADLTKIHEGAFKEIVRVLKVRLRRDSVSEIEVLTSFKSSILSAILFVNDAFVFAPVAYAETLNIFKQK